MSDILLIQPPIRDFYLTAKRTQPYGLACIAGALRHQGFDVAIADALATPRTRALPWPEVLNPLKPYYGRQDRSPFALFHQWRQFGYSHEHLVNQARKSGAWLIGISSLFTAYSGSALETAAHLKKALPHVKIVMGGHHPTALPEAVMQHDCVDYIVRGDGESGLPALAGALGRGGPLEKVPGLVWRGSDGRLTIRPPAIVRDLENLPLPAHDLIDAGFYSRNGKAGITLSATRGCPMRCTYCAVNAGSWHGYRRRSVAAVMRDLQRAAAGRAVGFIDFEDEHLNADKTWFRDLLTALEAGFDGHRPELRAMNGLYAPCLDDQLIGHMGRAGFRTLNLAMITTCAAQLKRFGRPEHLPAFDRVLASTERHGLTAVAYLIVAGPEQDPGQSVADLLYLAGRRVLAGVSVFYPAPGSRDYQWCQDRGALPAEFGLMRATALPLNHRMDRTQTATLLRLGRLLNFMKHLLDSGRGIPAPSPAPGGFPEGTSRQTAGEALLAAFLRDGKVRGVDEAGLVYDHLVDPGLTGMFLAGLKGLRLRGAIS